MAADRSKAFHFLQLNKYVKIKIQSFFFWYFVYLHVILFLKRKSDLF